MQDTGYYVPEEKWDRLAALYAPDTGDALKRSIGPAQDSYKKKPVLMMGGAGLVSTAMDYARFVQMLLNGGELDGVRILSPKTVDLMHSNVLGNLAERQQRERARRLWLRPHLRRQSGNRQNRRDRVEGRIQLGRSSGHGFLGRPERANDRRLYRADPQRLTKDQFKQLAYQAIVNDQNESQATSSK